MTKDQILSMKTWPYGPGISELLKMMPLYNAGPPVALSGPPGEVSISMHWNPYPLFTDTNNLRLVLFVHRPGLSIVFPGDLEKQGWDVLLKNAAFRSDLAKVRIFVASHHGRQSGYCEDVFNYCSPAVIIISDEPMQYDTQMDSYAKHAAGISWNAGPLLQL